MATESGLSRVTINTIEGEKTKPSVETAEKIAHAFGLSLSEFCSDDNDSDPEDSTDPDKPP